MDNICWYCKKCYGGCPWTEVLPDGKIRFDPVPGWTATPTLKNPSSERVVSYEITDCPLFEDDGTRERAPRREGLDWLRTYRGETKSLSEWARLYGLPANTLHARLDRGWPLKQALETPVRRRESKHG